MSKQEYLNKYLKERYKIDINGFEKLDLKVAINYLQEKLNYEFILVEAGQQTVLPYYLLEDPNENPVDSIFLSIYSGIVSLGLS